MSRFHGSTGGAGVTPNATYSQLVGTLAAGASGGFKLRRVSWGFTSANSVPASQQCVLNIARFTAAPAGGTSANLSGPLDPNSNPATAAFKVNAGTAFTSAGTISSFVELALPLNAQSAADMPWEQLEEWICTAGTANGFAFYTSAALPTTVTTTIVLNVEWEE